MADRGYIIGIDTGGTFTDVVLITPDNQVFIDKSPTTPRDFSLGVTNAIGEVAKWVNLDRNQLVQQCDQIKHGTTVATNALINRVGAKVGLITTRGFEDTTFIMRAVGRVAGLSEDEIKRQPSCVKPEPIVPKSRVRGLYERVDHAGRVRCPLNETQAEAAIRYLVEEQQVEAIAVNFLWSFVNPSHEVAVAKLIRALYPDRDLFITLSHELSPVIREYARSNTVILNAFLGHTVSRYLGDLAVNLRDGGYPHSLMIMQANGGIGRREEIPPIGILQSGPAGGIIATKMLADLLGHRNVISTDMGGTSFDVGLLTDGYWGYKRDPVVERFHISYPIVDVESIGAGGGTIAWIDPDTNTLKVGPTSAGADPGPACYGIGGDKPTVTDANVVLGYLNPNYFLGGRMHIDPELSHRALASLAEPLGMSVTDVAAGIYDIINAKMADLIRKQVVRVGHVPEDFVIYCFGGAGPVNAAGFAADLGIHSTYVFPTSSVFSAFGVAAADVIHTRRMSHRLVMPCPPADLNGLLGEVEGELLKVMEHEGFARAAVQFRRTFYMRYRRQLNELEVPAPTRSYGEADILAIMADFERRYEEVYGEGSAYSEAGIELISVSVDAVGPTPKPRFAPVPANGDPVAAAIKGERQAFFTGAQRGWHKARIYEYERLQPDHQVDGPAIIETPTTTVVIPPGKSARVDRFRNIELRV